MTEYLRYKIISAKDNATTATWIRRTRDHFIESICPIPEYCPGCPDLWPWEDV